MRFISRSGALEYKSFLLVITLAALNMGCQEGDSNSSDQGSADSGSGVSSGNFWNTPTPDFIDNAQRPKISLSGPNAVSINLNSRYIDSGASAIDSQDGDISQNIAVINNVNTSVRGDYLVRYQVSDSDGNEAIEKVRIVRVFDTEAVRHTKRPVGTSASHLGYYEHLPQSYDASTPSPLIIFHHGSGSNADLVGGSADFALESVANNGGPPNLLEYGPWDDSRPFVILSPQRSRSNSGVDMARLNAFLDYALATYNVDPDRVYITGWSQGGMASFLHAVHYPNKVRAVVPMAAGFFRGIPSNVCDSQSVSVWAFHGGSDTAVSTSVGQTAISAINRCGRTFPAKFSIFDGVGHGVHHDVFSLDYLFQANNSSDAYDQSIYDWLLAQ